MPSTDVDHELQVTDMNDNKLTVTIKSKDSAGSSSEAESPRMKASDSADDIQVVYEKEVPKLHGILKQRSRTTSESSDEVFHGYSRENSVSQESPISETEETQECELGRKKSVSFSEHVDKTMYKSGQSISSLHTTLKNKRKRLRKREQKKEDKIQRRRRRSSGSYSSDADDKVEGHDTGSTSEEVGSEADLDLGTGDGSPEVMEGKQAPLHIQTEDLPPTDTTEESSPEVQADDESMQLSAKKGVKKNKNRKKTKKSKSVKQDVCATDAHQPPETSDKNGKESVEEGKNVNAPAVIGSAQGDEVGGQGENTKNVQDTKKSVKVVKNEEDSDDEGQGDAEGQGDPRDLDGRTKTSETEGAVEQIDQLDHKTTCAFSFANSLMFDLDDD